MRCKYCKEKIDFFEWLSFGMCYWCHKAQVEVEDELREIERSKAGVTAIRLIKERRKYFEKKDD